MNEIAMEAELEPFPDMVLATPGLWRQVESRFRRGNPPMPSLTGRLTISCTAQRGGWIVRLSHAHGYDEVGPVSGVRRDCVSGDVWVDNGRMRFEP